MTNRKPKKCGQLSNIEQKIQGHKSFFPKRKDITSQRNGSHHSRNTTTFSIFGSTVFWVCLFSNLGLAMMMYRRAATAFSVRTLRTATVTSRNSCMLLPIAAQLRSVHSKSFAPSIQNALLVDNKSSSSTRTWMSTVSVPPPPTSNHYHKKLNNADATIIYTETDEAPALATYCLYPVIAKVRSI